MHEGEVVARVHSAVVIVVGLVRREVAERVDIVAFGVLSGHIGVGRCVEVDVELGHRHQRGRGKADVAAVACADIGVGGLVDFALVHVRSVDGYVRSEALVRDADVQIIRAVIRVGAGEEAAPIVAGCGAVAASVPDAQRALLDEIVVSAVVEVIVAAALYRFVGRVDEVFDQIVIAVVRADVFVTVFSRGSRGHVDAEPDGVVPQPDLRLDERLLIGVGIHRPDPRFGIDLVVRHIVHGHGSPVQTERRVRHIELVSPFEFGIDVRRRVVRGVSLGTEFLRPGRVGSEDIAAVNHYVGGDGGDVVERVRALAFRHVGAEGEVLRAGERVGADVIHAVVVLGDGEARIRERELFVRRAGEGGSVGRGHVRKRCVHVVVDVDVDADVGLLELLTEREVAREYGEELIQEVRLQQHSDVSGRDAHAVHERADVRGNLVGEQRQRVGQMHVLAEYAAQIERQSAAGRGFVRRNRFTRRGILRGGVVHHSGDECREFAEIEEHAGLSEIAEIDVQSRVVAHIVAVGVGIQEGRVVGVSSVHRLVVTGDFVDGHILAFDIAVSADIGRIVVRVALLPVVILVGGLVFGTFVAAQREIDSQHGVFGRAVVGRRGELHRRIDEVQEVFESEQVVRGIVGIFLAHEAHDELDERDKVEFLRQSDGVAVRVEEQTAGISRVKAAQIVDERTELELERHRQVESAHYVCKFLVAGHHVDDGIEVVGAVREEIFEQSRQVDVAAVRKEQVERDRFAERHRVEAVEVVVLFQLFGSQRIFALLGEVHVYVVDSDVDVEFRVVIVGVGARRALEEIDRKSGRFVFGAARIELHARGRAVREVAFVSDVSVRRLVEHIVSAVRGHVGCRIVGVILPAAVDVRRFVAHVSRHAFVHQIARARLTEVAAFLVEDEEPFFGIRVFGARPEHEVALVLGLRRVFEIGVSVALEHEREVESDIESVGHVYRDVESALELIVDEIAYRITVDGDDREQISHERIAYGEGQSALADKQRRHSLLRGEICRLVGVGRRDGVVRGDRFGGRRAADFRVIVNGTVEQFSQLFLDPIRDLGHGHRELGHIEEGQVDIQHIVHVIRRKPLYFRSGLGREVVESNRELGARQILHVEHQRRVKAQMRGGVTLVGLRDLDHDALEVAEDGGEYLADVDLPFGDGDLDFDGRTDRDGGVIERRERHVVVIFGADLRIVHLGVDAVSVGVRIALRLAFVSRRSLGLAFEDVTGQERFAAAETERYAADGKFDVHRADFRAEREIEFGQRGVRIVSAVQRAVFFTHVAVLPVVGLDVAVRAEFERGIFAAAPDVDRRVRFDVTDVEHHDVVAVDVLIEGVPVAIEDDALVILELHVSTRAVGVLVVNRFGISVVSGVRSVERAVFRLRVVSAVRAVGLGNGRKGVSVALVAVLRGPESRDGAAAVRHGDIGARLGGFRLIESGFVNADIFVLADLRAEGHFEVVEDVRKASEVGKQRRKHCADDALGEHDLHRGVGVDKLYEGVPHRTCGIPVRSGDRRRSRRVSLRIRRIAGAGGRRAHLRRLYHEAQEVGNVRIAVHHVEHIRAVEVEITVVEIYAGKHLVLHDVSVESRVKQFERHFDAVEIGGGEELFELLVGGEIRIGKRCKAYLAQIRRHGQAERDAVGERFVGVDLEHEVLKILSEQRTHVVAALSVGGEARPAGYAQGHALRTETGAAAVNVAVHEIDDVEHHIRHVDIGADLAVRKQDVVGSGNVDVDAGVRGYGNVESYVGTRGHDKFDAVAAAEIETDAALLLVEDEVVEAVLFTRARDEGNDVAEQVGRQHEVEPDAVGKQVEAAVLESGTGVGAYHYGAHERVEDLVDVNTAARICGTAVFRAVRRSHRLGAAAFDSEGRHAHFFEDGEQICTDPGTAYAGEIEIDIPVHQIDADRGAVGRVLGVEHYLDARLQRIEYGEGVESGQDEAAEDVGQSERFEVEQSGDVDVEVVADGIVDVELKAEGGDEHIDDRGQRRVGDAAERVAERGHVKQRVDDVGQAHAAADVHAVVVLHECTVGQLNVSVRERIGAYRVRTHKLVSRVRTVLHRQVESEARHAAGFVTLEGILVQSVDLRRYVGIGGVGHVRILYRKSDRGVIGVHIHADGRRVEVDVHGHFRTQIESREDAFDVDVGARHRAYDAEEHRFGDVERDVSFAHFEHDVESRLFPFVAFTGGGHRFGRTDGGLRHTERFVHHFEHGADYSRVLEHEVVLGQHTHIHIERGAADIHGEHEVLVFVGIVPVPDLKDYLGGFGVREVDVRTESDVHAESEVVLYLHAEFEREIADYRGEHVADGQFAVGQILGLGQSKFERDVGAERHHAVAVEDAHVRRRVEVIGQYAVRVVVDGDAESAERESYRKGIRRDGKLQPDVALRPLALAVEHGQEAVGGIELYEVLGIEFVSGQHEIEQRREEVRAEAHRELLIGHVNAVDDGKYGGQDVVLSVRRHGSAAHVAHSVAVGVGVSRAFRRGHRGLSSFRTALRGSAARREEVAEADAGHGNVAAYDAAFGRADVESAPAVVACDEIHREQILPVRHIGRPYLKGDVGVREYVSDRVGGGKVVREAQHRAQIEFQRSRHASVDDETEDKFLNERLHVVGDVRVALGEVVDPLAYRPVLGAVRARGETDRAAECGVYAVKFQPRRAELVVLVDEAAYILVVFRVDVVGNDARDFVERRPAYAYGQRRERHSDVSKISHGDRNVEQIAVFVAVAGDIAPVEAESRVDLAEIYADEVDYDLRESFRDFDDESVGSHFHQEFEHSDAVFFLRIRRGHRLSARTAGRACGDDSGKQFHDVEFRAYACAYKRACVNIKNTLRIICRQQDFFAAARGVHYPEREFGFVLAGRLHAREGREHRAEVHLRVQRKFEIDVHAFGNDYAAQSLAERDVVRLQVGVESERERHVHIRLVEEIDEIHVGIDFDVALPVDDGVDAADRQVKPEVAAESERNACGQTFGSVRTGQLQSVVEVDADACRKIQALAVRAGHGDGKSVNAEQSEQLGDRGGHRYVEIQIAEVDVGGSDKSKQPRGQIGRRAGAGTVGRFLGGNGFADRECVREEGLEIHLHGKTAQETFGRVEIEHAVHEPYTERSFRVIGRAFSRKFEIYVERGHYRADVHSRPFGKHADESGDVGEFRTQSEHSVRAEGFLERGKHGHHEIVRLRIGDVRKLPCDGVHGDVRLHADLDRFHSCEHLRHVEIEEVLQRRKTYGIAVLPVGGTAVERALVVGRIDHRAELHADAHAEGGEHFLHVLRTRGEREIELDVLGGREAVVREFEHDVARDGYLRPFQVAREHERPDVVEYRLRQRHLHGVDVEDVLHIDVDVVDDRLDQSHDVLDGFAFGIGSVRVDHPTGRYEFFRRGDEFVHRSFVGVGESGVVQRGFHHADEILDRIAEDVVEVDPLHMEFARADEPGEIDISGLVRADVGYPRAHVFLFVSAGQLEQERRTGVVEHVDRAHEVQFQGPVDALDVDGSVEQFRKVAVKRTVGNERSEQSAERPHEFVGSDGALVESEIEGKSKVESERRIFLRAVDVYASGGKLRAHVETGLFVVVVYALAADGDGYGGLLGTVSAFEAGAVGVEVKPDVETHAGEFAHAFAVCGGEVGDKIEGHILQRFEEGEVDAEHVLHHAEDGVEIHSFGEQIVKRAGRKKSAERAAEQVGKRYGHLDPLRAVLARGDA